MRCWGSRDDTVVADEPLYAHYLDATERAHPGREEVIAHHDPDWRAVVDRITGPIPDGTSIFYQKHMAHHLLPEMDWDWVRKLRNAFLIREPREMFPSLVAFLPEPTLTEQRGTPPPVIVARDVL
jgi:hypothetical protein